MRTIAIASSKGGVGKTTTAMNLGAALSRAGVKNVVVDCNVTNPNLGLYLGAGETPKNLHTVLLGKHKLHEAVHLHHSGLHLIPGAINLDDCTSVDVKKILDLESGLKSLSGIKILDSASGITHESIAPLAIADDIIVITTPEIPAIMDALKTIQSAQKIGVNVCGIVLNRVKGSSSQHGQYVEKVREILGKPVIGIIPEDSNILHAQNKQSPIVHSHPNSKASLAFHKLALCLK